MFVPPYRSTRLLVDKTPAQTVEILHQFLTKKILFCLVVLGVVGTIREAVDALVVTAKLLDVRYLSPLVRFEWAEFRSHQP